MQRRESNELILAGISIAIVIAAVGAVAIALVTVDKAFVPLAGALISGCATLVGVAIGALVLRFNYRSQSNPLKLELYKKRTDALIMLYEKIVIIRFLYIKYIDYSNGYIIRQELLDDLKGKIAELKTIGHKCNLLIPESTVKTVAIFMRAAGSHGEKLVQGFSLIRKNETNAAHDYHEMHDNYIKFVNQCRRYIGVKELSDGILDLLGVEDPDKCEIIPDEDRIHKLLGLSRGASDSSDMVNKRKRV